MINKEDEEYINSKIEKEMNKIVYTFYELRIKRNMTEEEIEEFLRISKIKFENMGYKVFYTGQHYMFECIEKIVQSNELMIAVKEVQDGT